MIRRTVILLIMVVSGAIGFLDGPQVNADDDGCAGCNNPYNRPDGQLVSRPVEGIFLIQGCGRRHLIQQTDIDSYRFDNPNPVPISSAEYAQLAPNNRGDMRAREGSLFAVDPNDPVVSERNKLYIIDTIGAWPTSATYQKRYVTATAWGLWFGPCSYGAPQIVTVPSSYTSVYASGSDVTASGRPDGQLISYSGVYLITDGGQRRWVQDPDSLASYNFIQPICPVSSPETYPRLTPNVRAREGTLVLASGTPVYIIERDPSQGYWKRRILSPDGFAYYGYSGPSVRVWTVSGVGVYTETAFVHPIKTLWQSRWYRDLTTQQLTIDRRYFSGISPSTWDTAITNARNAWDSTRTTVTYVESAYFAANDIHVSVDNYFSGSGGWTEMWDIAGVRCDATCMNPVRHSEVRLDHTGNAAAFRQTTASHEMGHALSLAHDGLNAGEARDFQCGAPRVPQTIMDYDCDLLTDGNGNPVFTAPLNWDICGVNHAYPSAWGHAGC